MKGKRKFVDVEVERDSQISLNFHFLYNGDLWEMIKTDKLEYVGKCEVKWFKCK